MIRFMLLQGSLSVVIESAMRTVTWEVMRHVHLSDLFDIFGVDL